MTMFLEELRAVAERVRRHAVQEIDVPGAGGRIVVRFRPPAADDALARARLTELVAVYRVGDALSAEQERQLIIDCCDEILRRDPVTGALEQFDGEGGPLRFDAGDERWGADITGNSSATAHDCVRKLYSLDEQPLAASGAADSLIDWLSGLSTEIAARAEGNFASTEAS